ncbi:hypothetical protein COU77_00670 [Candidatus Peregrinibacteria bacterium CG10_big_fil_rev_8_21_14_0_10_49_16]|nr:MAG: hypothetical protein COW95_04615 [Candidatus Peregrinibacteria bacterium CG22_combo_CG10-13_8_21_14_all_49_11]PIR52377.1 MAG: hypothetical protein COU77_00670 [Candidatus Peregrinibacteria bacterium CG10_big_fil_rev_8_21_14_0_10_49_16]
MAFKILIGLAIIALLAVVFFWLTRERRTTTQEQLEKVREGKREGEALVQDINLRSAQDEALKAEVARARGQNEPPVH